MAERKVNVAVIGLGFGAEFIPIYQKHPNARMLKQAHVGAGHDQRVFLPCCEDECGAEG